MRTRSLLLIALLALPLGAQTVRDQMLVSTGWLQHHLKTVKVLHVGTRAEYDAGHVPGAVLLEMSSLLVQRDGTPNELPPIDTLEQVFRAAGLDSLGRIVVYSSDPLFAARTWFTLDYLGQGSRTALLDGGLAKWTADGCPISRDPVVAKAGSFQARSKPEAVVRLAAMRELVRLGDQSACVIIDARPPGQFSGEEPGPDVRRGGHIPGAVNVPMGTNFKGDGTLRSVEELRALYESAGVTKDCVNVTHCRTGMQASVTYFVLAYLGYDAALYDGSFLEWSNAGEIV